MHMVEKVLQKVIRPKNCWP